MTYAVVSPPALTLCAVLQQRLGHLIPQRAALSWKLPCHFQALSRPSSVKYDGVDHSQVVPKLNTHVQIIQRMNTYSCSPDSIKHWGHLTMSREETLWLLTGVNLTLSDLTSPGCRSRLYTYGLVEPSTNPELNFIGNVCETKQMAC